MRGKYDKTEAPGHWRDRSHKQTTITPNDGIPSIEICEQRVILAEDENGNLAEQVLKELPAFSVVIDQTKLAEEFPELDLDDKPTGRTLTGYQAMISYRSFVRAQQFARDATPPTADQNP